MTTCSTEGCVKKVYCKGMCKTCYQIHRKIENGEAEKNVNDVLFKKCKECGEKKPVSILKKISNDFICNDCIEVLMIQPLEADDSKFIEKPFNRAFNHDELMIDNGKVG